MRYHIALLALVVCVGCSMEVRNHGNLAGVVSPELVQDTVFILFETYPPAQTRLVLTQEAEDDFGIRLVEALRLHGYAVAEYAKPDKKGRDGKPPPQPDGLPFGYLIDGTGAENEIRISIRIGGESLSRLYQVTGAGQEARYVPLGFWSHRRDIGEKDEPVT